LIEDFYDVAIASLNVVSNLQPAMKRSDTALNSRTSRRVLGETGSWSLSCDCFAF
jgi:hypothetical protein